MKKIELLYGIIIGLITSLIGVFLFLELFTEYGFKDGITILKNNNNLGKLVSLGAILNLAVFFLLLKLKKDLMARGVVLALIITTLITIFI